MAPDLVVNAKQHWNFEDVEKVTRFLQNGGLCVLPSDSAYVLTGLVTVEGVSHDIDLLLDRKGLPMSLAFGGLRHITDRIDFNNQAYNFFKKLTPGGLTFVGVPKKKLFYNLSENCLYADGTIGVRLTESIIETQIADFFPIPSCPICDCIGKPITTADEVWPIIEERIVKSPVSRKFAFIIAPVKKPGQLSTVVREKKQNGYRYIEIIRRGTISYEDIYRTALECKYKGVI